MKRFSKREINRAQTKVNCLNATLNLSADYSFHEIKIKDIASHASITEMTFFNYFKTKDDLLLYYMKYWGLKQLRLQLDEPLQGREAIKRIFSDTATDIKKDKSIMTSIIALIAKLKEWPETVELEKAERYLLFPTYEALYDVQTPTLCSLLHTHLAEEDSIVDKESAYHALITLFYGAPLNAHMTQQDVAQLYKSQLDLLFSCSETLQMRNVSDQTIVLVDSDIGFRKSLKKLFTRHYKHVYEATNGLEALNIYFQYKPNVVVINQDVTLIDAETVVHTIGNDKGNTDIVVLSNEDAKPVSNFLKKSCMHIMKPFEIDKLITHLNAIAEQ